MVTKFFSRQMPLPNCQMSQPMRLWYLSYRRPAKAQASLRICAVSPEPSLFANMKYGIRWRGRAKIRHLAPLDGCACTFEEWVISWAGSFHLLKDGLHAPDYSWEWRSIRDDLQSNALRSYTVKFIKQHLGSDFNETDKIYWWESYMSHRTTNQNHMCAQQRLGSA